VVGAGVVALAPKNGDFFSALWNVPMTLLADEICQ
jgi:hypothetical protein